MAQDNEIKLQIAVDADEGSIARAKRALDGLEDSVKDVASEVKRAGKIGDFGEIVDGAKKAERAVDSLADSARQAGKELQSAVDVANDRFSAVSNQVSLAGDAESALNTIGGAASAFGAGQAGAAIGVAAQIPALVEALPRLQTALAGLPAAAAAAAAALGPVGIAFAAAAAAIAGAVLFAQKGVEDLKRATAARLSAEEDIATQIAGGLTTAGAQEQLDELKRLQAEQTRLVQEAEAERKAIFEQSLRDTLGVDASARLREGLGLTSAGEVDAALTRRKEALAETSARIQELANAIEANRFVAEPAAAAIESLAQSIPVTTQATQQRVQSERQYQNALQQTSVVAVQSAAEQRRAANREAGERDRDRAATRRQQYSDMLARIRDMQLGEQKALDDRSEAIQDYYNNEQSELRKHYKSLEDIRIDAQRAERDALRSGDIFAIRDIRLRTEEQLSDSTRDFNFDRSQRAQDFRNQNNITFNITNADPQAVAYQVQRQLAGTLR
jgi:hypothetical protein